MISARPSKQTIMVRTFLKLYGASLRFFFLQEQLNDIIFHSSRGLGTGRSKCKDFVEDFRVAPALTQAQAFR